MVSKITSVDVLFALAMNHLQDDDDLGSLVVSLGLGFKISNVDGLHTSLDLLPRQIIVILEGLEEVTGEPLETIEVQILKGSGHGSLDGLTLNVVVIGCDVSC
jgi:hypothetical protein